MKGKLNLNAKLAILMAVLLMASLVVGCSPTGGTQEGTTTTQTTSETSSTEDENDPSQNDEEVTLVVMTYDDDVWQRYVEDFSEKNSSIKVERRLSQAVDTGAVQVLLASDDAPDILMVNSGPGRVLPLAKAGMLMDLTEYYESRGWRENTVSYVMDALANFDDKIFEVVDYIDVFQFYYNKAIFADVGLETPTTWDEFISVLETLKSEGIQPIVAGGSNNFMLGWLAGNIFQSSCGFDMMTDIIYGDTSWNNPEMIRAYETLLEFVDNGYINSDAVAIDDMEARTRHAVGQAAMAVIGNGYLKTFVDQGICEYEDFGTFMMPSMDSNRSATPTAGLAQSWIVNKNTQKIDACLAFLDYAFTDKIDFLIAEESGQAPAAVVPSGKQLFSDAQAAVDAVAGGSGYNPSVFTSAGVKDAYYVANQSVITKQITPLEAVETIQLAKEEDLN